MSEREKAAVLLERVPDYKIGLVLAYLQGLTDGEDIPNDETVAAIEALERGEGKTFTGSTDDFINMMLED